MYAAQMLVSHVGRVGRIAAQRWGTLSHVTGQTARLSAPELVLLSDRLLWRGEGCSQYSSDGANEEEKEDKRQNARRNDNFESSGSFRTLDDTDKVLEKLAGAGCVSMYAVSQAGSEEACVGGFSERYRHVLQQDLLLTRQGLKYHKHVVSCSLYVVGGMIGMFT